MQESVPKTFSQSELNDLVLDLSLSKESAELLASRLNEKHLLVWDTNVTFYRNRDAKFIPFFEKNDDLVYCTNTNNVLLWLGVQAYKPVEWRFFLDSSKYGLKCVLVHNTNTYASILIGHSIVLKEKYDAIKQVIEHINYSRHKWVICVDLKMVNFLLGQHSGYTKHPCFFCMWDSRTKEKHYTKKEWPSRELKIGEKALLMNLLSRETKSSFLRCTLSWYSWNSLSRP